MEVNIPEIVADLRAAFDRYEAALVGNDIAALDALFWDSPRVVRFGATENLYGIEAIRAFRAARSPDELARELAGIVITTFGRDFGTASALTRRTATGRTGRQTQTWVRRPEGWRVVAAHVSFLEYGFASP